MLKSADELRQELADVRARVKPQAQWTSFQDRADQKMIERRIRHLQNHLDSVDRESAPLRKETSND